LIDKDIVGKPIAAIFIAQSLLIKPEKEKWKK